MRSIVLSTILACGCVAPTAEVTGQVSTPLTSTFERIPHPIPVILFHSICPTTCVAGDTYGFPKGEFARTLDMIRDAGFTTVSSADYTRYIKHDWTNLPTNPILITFDDSRLDAYENADPVLAAANMRATMFVITGSAGDPGHMSWDQIGAAYTSGRWDIELHAHKGHVRNEEGLPWLSYKLPGETYDQWVTRFEGDMWEGFHQLHSRLPNYAHHLFAVPYGDYGQKNPNDPAIVEHYKWFMNQRVTAWFTQPTGNSPEFSRALLPTKERGRYTVTNTTTVEKIYAWLLDRV